MKSKTIVVNDGKRIENRFRRLNLTNSILIALAVPGIISFLYLIFTNLPYYHQRISIFYPIVHSSLFIAPYMLFSLFNLELLKVVRTKKIGVYTKKNIIRLCDEIIKENFNPHEEIPSVYIVRNIGNNAFAINSLLLNCIKTLNSITISRALFQYLNVHELKAVIAHEIGHFKRYISIYKRITFIPFLFIVLITYLTTAVLLPVLGIPAFTLYLISFYLIHRVMTLPFKLFKKDVEFLSDLYAANKYGKLYMVNALIKIYQMNNLDILLNLEISNFVMQSSQFKTKDIPTLAGTIKRKLSKKIHDEDLIKKEIEIQLKKIKPRNLKTLSANQIKKRNRALKRYQKNLLKLLNHKTIDWDDVDNHQRDGRIDAIEYEGLIETLENNPELQLFKTPKDNIRKMKFGTHPALRERILFVHYNCARLE